jgi:hypothetical protein
MTIASSNFKTVTATASAGSKNIKAASKVSKKALRPAIQKSLRSRAFKYFKTTSFAKGGTRFVNDLIFFIGAQAYKYIYGKPWTGGSGDAWTRDEVAGAGNGHLNDWISKRLVEERKKTGATYVTGLVLDSQDKEAVEELTKYQNEFAKITGQPSIIHAITNQRDTKEASDEINDFFNEIAKGNVIRGGDGDRISTNIDESIKIKKISSFSNFR